MHTASFTSSPHVCVYWRLAKAKHAKFVLREAPCAAWLAVAGPPGGLWTLSGGNTHQDCVDQTPAAMKVSPRAQRVNLKCCNTSKSKKDALCSCCSFDLAFTSAVGRHVSVCVYMCVHVCVSSGGLFEASLMVSLVLSRKHLSVHWMSSSRCFHCPLGCVRARLLASACERTSVLLYVFG